MDLGLKGKKAIVTGATRGIGRAIAETLADEGADVAIFARGQELGGTDIKVSNPSAFAPQNTEQDWESSFQIDLMGAVPSVEVATPFLEQAAEESGDAAIV